MNLKRYSISSLTLFEVLPYLLAREPCVHCFEVTVNRQIGFDYSICIYMTMMLVFSVVVFVRRGPLQMSPFNIVTKKYAGDQFIGRLSVNLQCHYFYSDFT